MAEKLVGSHEVLSRDEEAKTSSNRSFGLVFAGFFAILGIISIWADSSHWVLWFGFSILFGLLAFFCPIVLGPLNWLWARFGLLLHMIVSPVVLALIFYACITPIGFLMRLSGKDPLRLRFEPNSGTYWVRRQPPGPAPDTFKNQF